MRSGPARRHHAAEIGRRRRRQHLSAKLRVHEAESGLPDGAIKIIADHHRDGGRRPGGRDLSRDYKPRLVGTDLGRGGSVGGDRRAHGARRERPLHRRFRFARTVTILAARRAEVAAIDTVFVEFPRHGDGLAANAWRPSATVSPASWQSTRPRFRSSTPPSRRRPKRCRRCRSRRGASTRPETRASSASTARCTTDRICGWPRGSWRGPGRQKFRPSARSRRLQDILAG